MATQQAKCQKLDEGLTPLHLEITEKALTMAVARSLDCHITEGCLYINGKIARQDGSNLFYVLRDDYRDGGATFAVEDVAQIVLAPQFNHLHISLEKGIGR